MTTVHGTRRAVETLALLRGRIESGQWPVGTCIPTEPELQQLTGVGRSTVREAVRALASMGMLDPRPRRGTLVVSATPMLSSATVFEGYSQTELLGYRRALEVEAAQQAALYRTVADLSALEGSLGEQIAQTRTRGDQFRSEFGDFHLLVVAASGNRLLAAQHRLLTGQLRSSGVDAELAAGLEPAQLLDDHDKLFTAIRGQNPGDAAHVMAAHVGALAQGIAHAITGIPGAQTLPILRRERDAS